MKKLFILFCLYSFSLFAQENKENTDFQLAVSLYNDKLYDLALDQFKRYIELYPNTEQGIEARFYVGLSYFNLKRYEEAKNSFQNFALNYQLNQRAPEAWWKIGECNYLLGKINEAAITFERIKIFHPTSDLAPKGLLKSAEYYAIQNDFDNSERVLNMLLSEYYSNDIVYEARIKLADLYLKKNLTNKAIEQYEKILSGGLTKDKQNSIRLSLGRILASSGKIESAIKLYQDIIINNTLNSYSDSARIELGIIYSNIGDYENSKKYFKSVLDSVKLKNSFVKKLLLYNLANIDYQLSNYLEALRYIQQYEEQFESDTTITNVYYLAAEIHRKLGDYVKSNDYLKKIINSNDNILKRKSLLLYSQNCLEIKNYNLVIESYNSFIDIYPSDFLVPNLLYNTGLIYKNNLSDYRKAVQKFEDLISKYSNNSLVDDALFNLANSYELNKELDKALTKYNELITNYSNSPYYNEAKEKIEHINLYVPINNIDGFKKIGSLLQEVISNKPKGEISYKLGEVYYNDMKDYKSSLAQFDIAINSNDLNDSLKAIAKYYKMLSNYYILLEEGIINQSDLEELKNFISNNPNHPFRSDVILKLFNLEIKNKTNEQILNMSLNYYNTYPELKERDKFLGKALSILESKNDVNNLIKYSNIIIDNFPNSEYTEYSYYLKGYATFLTNKDSLAESYFNEYLKKYSNGRYLSSSYFYLSEIYKKNANFQKVFECYNKIKNFFYYSKLADTLNNLYANAYFESGDYKSAYKLYYQCYTQSVDNIFINSDLVNHYIFKLAECSEKLEDFESAKKYYSKYIYNNPNGLYYNESLISLALIYKNEGNNDASENYFKLIKPTNKPDILFKYSNILYENSQYKLALNYLYSALKYPDLEKNKKDILFKIVLTNLKLGNIEEAVVQKKNLKKDYDLNDQEKAELSFNEAIYYYNVKNYKTAEDIFSDISSDYDKTNYAAWAYYYIGKIKEISAKIQDAHKNYTIVIQKYPGSEAAQSANLMLGNYYFRSEKYSEAVKFYKNIVDKKVIDKDIYSVALDNIIESYYQLQIFDAAIEYCRKFIEMFPKDPSIYDKKLKIGILYQKLKYFDQAIIHYKSLLSSSKPELEVEIRYYLGECYFSKGDYSTALIEFLKIPYIMDKSVRIDWVPASLYMAGQCYEKLGKYEQAIVMYRQIIEKPNIDSTYKAQAEKEIDRVKSLLLPNREK
ncbi:MAG TPA: tetratricopeptide repeat protein [Bacteroidota bacterium]|nr:tetratricopeptide repeat protein [Bacteroidota bacterium]